jgi:hypothetical protein
MAGNVVTINRAPVLTLWGAVVAARMGYTWEEALTLGKAVAGLNAQAKGRRLGIYGQPKGPERGGEPKKVGLGEDYWVEIVGRPIPVKQTAGGVRAVVKDRPIDPGSVSTYLQSKLRDNLAPVREAMEELAGSVSPEDLAKMAYVMYETFRPKIPSGVKGWGVAGELDLDLVRAMARRASGP